MKQKIFLAVGLLVAGMLSAQTRVTVDGICYLLNPENLTATVTHGVDAETGSLINDTYAGSLIIPGTIEAASEPDGPTEEYTVTAIGDSAFAHCQKLNKVTIPATVQRLGLHLLAESPDLFELTFEDSADPIRFRYVSDETGTSMSFEEAAVSCQILYLGRDVAYDTEEEYPMPIFHTWGSVQAVTFGEEVTEIPLAFCPYSRDIKSIQVNTPSLLPAGTRMFAFLDEDDPKPDAKAIDLFVPQDLVAAYTRDANWSRFSVLGMDIAQQYHIEWVDGYFDFIVGGLFFKKVTDTDGSTAVEVAMPQVWYLNEAGAHEPIWSQEFPYRQTEITIPESITVYDDDVDETRTYRVIGIGDYSFREAKKLARLTIPNSIKYVGTQAFDGALKLKSLDIPETITSVGWLAFARAGFEEIVIPASSSEWAYNEGLAAFQENKHLQKVTFAKGTTRISDRIFFGCEALRVINIPDEVRLIGAGAFAGCYALRELQLPASLEKLEGRMFRECPLRELVIPANVKEVDPSALLATEISHLTVSPDNPIFDSRDNCNAIIRTAGNVLVTATNGAFIPETVDTIGGEAFAELPGLRSITLPAGLRYIAEGAFHDVDNLTIVTSHIEEPAGILKENAFNSDYEEAPMNKATLYVPAGTKALYENDSEWKKFKHIVELDPATKPAEVADLKPIVEDGEADLSKITGETDLTNAVVDNMYLTCDTANGDHYDATEKAIVYETVVDEAMMSSILAAAGNMDIIRNNFSGVIIEIPAGKGTITITFQTSGDRELAVTIGKDLINRYAKAVKDALDIEFDVAQTTYVYIYPVEKEKSALTAPRKCSLRKSSAADEVLIYGAKWQIKNVISGVESVQQSAVSVQKIFRDGQLYILREGKTYDIHGNQVE